MTAGATLRTVSADGVLLEPQVAAHAGEMFALLSDPAIYEFENSPPDSEAWLAQRFQRLESRESGDGRERWLNWIVRLPAGDAIGYVQATIDVRRHAGIAYVFASRFWGRGLARRAVEAMMAELVEAHGVTTLTAVLKAANFRSLRLLRRLGFERAADQSGLEANEIRMRRELQPS